MPDLLSSLLDQPALPAIGPLHIGYDGSTPLAKLLADPQTLAIIEFDSAADNSADARLIGIDLPLLSETPVREVWRCDRKVYRGPSWIAAMEQ